MPKSSSRTIPGLLAEITARDPDREAVVDHAARLTYAQFSAEVAHAARALLAHGIGHGDRVGILAGNRAEWLIADFAALSIGAIAVGLNTWSTARELAYQLEHAEVKLLVIEQRFRDRSFPDLLAEARALAGGLPALATVVVLGDTAARNGGEWGRFLDAGDAIPAAELAAASARVQAEDVACLLYTSGSTALPKGVPLRHCGLVDNMWEIGERQGLRADDRLWLAVSLFWSLACVNAVFAVMTHGGTIVLQHHFDAEEALRLIEAERLSVFYGTPNMALALSEHPRLGATDLSSLRTGVTIGSPAQVARVAALGVSGICNVYGLTEAYGNSAVTETTLPLERRVETVGRALAGTAIRIVDPDSGAVQGAGGRGEIQLRGNVTPGYWRAPERDAEAFTADGWFRTGDLGVLDEDGYLYYRGRLKEMIKTGGINVAPAEVEETLSRHPAVELAFVTGIPDPRLDEALAAVVVLRRDHGADAETLAAHCRASMAAYKTPRRFRFVRADELPLTTTGKLQRNRLADLFDDADGNALAEG